MAKHDWRCGAARNLPIGPTQKWDGDAAAKRMLDAADIGGRNPRPDMAKRGFALYDAANPKLRGSYKLPFADVIDGKQAAIAAGIRAAAAGLPQADVSQLEAGRAGQIIGQYEGRATAAAANGVAGADWRGRQEQVALEIASLPLASAAGRFDTKSLAHRLPHLADRLLNTPLALYAPKAEIILAAIGERFGITHMARANGDVLALAGIDIGGAAAESRGYDVMNGIAAIPVCGTLVQKLGSVRPFSGMTGYDGLRYCIDQAMDDADVRAIAFDVDSPGGEVSGLFGLVDHIYGLRGRKPMWSILSENAYSAGYAIASAADRVIVPRTGGVGSIGVIALIADLSKMLERTGITVNVIQFGARKADGLDVLPMTLEARERFQADVDVLGGMFVDSVARNRRLDAVSVRAMEASTYLGAAGLGCGLADAVAEPDAAYRDLLASLS